MGDILAGFLSGGLIGGTVGLITRWFGRSKRKSDSQKWKPLGVGAVGDILKGFLTGGLIGGAVALIERWFGKSKRKREGQRWKPLGAGAAGDVLKGFLTGGLIAGALKLIISWFSKSKRKREGQRWKPIGVGAAADILGGFLKGGLIAGAIELVASWFSKSKNKADKHRWKPIGVGAASRILTGFTTGGLIAGTVALIGSWFRRAKEEREGQDWKGIGVGAAVKTVGGFVGGGIPGVVARVIGDAAKKGNDKKPEFEKSGKDSARGFCKGFGIPDLGKCMLEQIKGAWDKVRKWGGEGSPWRRTMRSGIDAARGFALGLLRDGGLAERNARRLAERVAKAIRDGVVNLGDVPRAVWDQLLKSGWIGNPRDNAERLYRPAAAGARQRQHIASSLAPPRVAAGLSHGGRREREEMAARQQERLGVLTTRLARAIQRGAGGDTLIRLRREIELTKVAQALARQRLRASDAGPDKRIAIMAQQAQIARRLGNEQQVDRLRRQIDRAQAELRRQEDQRRPTPGGGQQSGAQVPQRPHRGTREAHTSARGGAPPGFTAADLRAALKEHTRDMARLLRAGMGDAPNLREFQKSLDRSLGGYFGFRRGIGPEPQ